ncbi:MAG: histidine kinase N-terminal 7TM domain-containing protein, partial [Candidatus Aenigmatarchaeota archaeon]
MSLRRITVAVFLVLVVIKVTNPIHNLYFTTEFASSPFYHLAVYGKGMHWISMGLSYGLAMIGYFMLLEKFNQVGYSTKPLAFLLGITGAPLILDIIGFSSPQLIDITYEPIGVAIFAVGVLYVFFEDFKTVQIAGTYKEPIIVLDSQNRIREYNERAQEIFSNLRDETPIGKPLENALPELDKVLGSETSILEKEIEGETLYFEVSQSPFSAGQEQLGRVIVFGDITERREAEQREEFLHSLLRHDLRNKLQASLGYSELLKEEDLTEKQEEFIGKDWKTKQEALDLIEKVRKLRKANQEGVKRVELNPMLQSSVEKYRPEASKRNMDITAEETDAFVEGGSLLEELFSNLIINSIVHSEGS